MYPSGLRLCRALAAATLVVAPFLPAAAQTGAFPDRPIRVVVGTPAGSGIDFILRVMSPTLQAELGQPLVIDNRPGADGIVAARLVAGAPPDGHVLLAATRTQIAVNPVIYASIPYDPSRDLAPVSMLAYQSILVVAHPSLPVRSIRELVDHTRAHPGSVNYGTGSSTFMLATEELRLATGADLRHIPYNGVPPTVTAILAGDVHVALLDVTPALAAVRGGRLRALAVSGTTRLALLPDVPTLAESGVAGYETPVWVALYSPAGTPGGIVARLGAAVARALDAPEVREKLLAAGEVARRDTDATAALVRRLGLAPR